MFIDAQQNNYKKELSMLLLLKLLYRQGKTKLTGEDLLLVEYVNAIKSRKTTKQYIRTLIKLRFISYNQRTGYYLLRSFDKIRADKSWEVRLAFPVDYSNCSDINAVTGAVIYGYLHKDFWRKVKREKSVTISGFTFNFPSVNFNYKDKPAPVSVIGINQIFDISIATASRLKKSAVEAGLIKVIQNYSEPIKDKEMAMMSLKYIEKAQNVMFIKNAYRLRLIDTIYPRFYFTKRTNLKT